MTGQSVPKELEPAEGTSTEQDVAFAGLGGPGWRCDFCGEIQWASERPPRPQRCPRCGHGAFTKTEKWQERLKVGRSPRPLHDQIADGELERMHQELCDLQAAIVRQDPALDDHTRCIAVSKIGKLQKQIKALARIREPVPACRRGPDDAAPNA